MAKAPSKAKKSKSVSTTWPKHLSARLKNLRAKMAESDLAGMLITRDVDVRYITGFPGEDSWALVTARQVWLISDSRFDEEIDTSCPWVKKVIRAGGMVEEVAKIAGDSKLKAVGFQADHITLQTHKSMTSRFDSGVLKPTKGWLVKMRSVKDEVELRSIRRSIALMEQAVTQTLDQIRPGMSESELVALLEYNVRWIGASGVAFPTIIAIGANTSFPHHLAGRTRVKANTPILIDCGAKANGYCSDMTRVVTLGGFSQKLTEVYKIVREAQLAAIDAIAPGKKLSDIDAVARDHITQAGYGENFGHGLGHGIGLEIHEQPSFSRKAAGELEPGQVVTVEPGIYLPGVGGVRIEDDVLVTEKGHRKLTSLPSDLESAII